MAHLRVSGVNLRTGAELSAFWRRWSLRWRFYNVDVHAYGKDWCILYTCVFYTVQRRSLSSEREKVTGEAGTFFKPFSCQKCCVKRNTLTFSSKPVIARTAQIRILLSRRPDLRQPVLQLLSRDLFEEGSGSQLIYHTYIFMYHICI